MPKLVNKICIECGKKFLADSRPHHKRCSNRCRYSSESYSKLRSNIAKEWVGKKNPNWHGGVRIAKNGYVYIHCPKHPGSTKEGYVMEHRLKMEKKLKRYLLKEEVVHHINHIPNDNRIKNLKLFSSHSEHISMHNRKRKGRIKTLKNK